MTTAILQVENLCKSFGGVHAIRDLSFQVAHGEILGLIGPNGSGKSTTVNVLAGVFPATSGEIRLGGGHIQTLPEYERVSMGLAGVDTPELRSACAEERRLARAARDYVTAVITPRVTLSEIGPDKYAGRIVARVALAGSPDLSSLLLRSGHGRPYHGGRRGRWC